MQSEVAGSRNGPISLLPPKEKQNVIEFVLGFYADHQRRIPVLFENDGRGYRGFKTMGLAARDNSAKRAAGFTLGFVVVQEMRKEPLRLEGCPAALNYPPFFFGEL
ncbi:MAG: hypothetical protein DMF61_19755 [Blastocatellia bacterium AA13]|nr:MAG: hypothetical protein DMF61_19755 [Blastocatellia bacterium AA13]